jgi:hypothetical protein
MWKAFVDLFGKENLWINRNDFNVENGEKSFCVKILICQNEFIVIKLIEMFFCYFEIDLLKIKIWVWKKANSLK